MAPSTPPVFPTTANAAEVGPTCQRSRLSPPLRLGITFAVLFALKWTLPFVVPSAAVQVLVLLVVATFFAWRFWWRFWWRCGSDRRGPIILIASIWIAGLAKILLAAR